MTHRAPTDDQLADILRFVARTCLEVERGLRPPEHLEQLMGRAAADRWSRVGRLGRFRGGPVVDTDLGSPRWSRLTDSCVTATVVTRTEGDRWGALTFRLEAERGHWRIAELQRLLAAAHYRTTGDRRAPEPAPADRLASVTEERKLARAALAATRQRLAELRGAPGVRAVRDLVRYWRRKVAELDRELTELATRRDTRQTVIRLLRR